MKHIRTLLPPGYEIHTSYDATEFIQEELDKIYVRTGLTILILLLFVLLITRNVRYLFLIIISLSINLCYSRHPLLFIRVGDAIVLAGGYHDLSQLGDR